MGRSPLTSSIPLAVSHLITSSIAPHHCCVLLLVSFIYSRVVAKMDMLLEMELGITGGEEDGVDNTDVKQEDLYTKPEEIWEVQKALQAVPNAKFTVAAAFGNVHGVYAPGNVRLDPKILDSSQKFIAKELGMPEGSKPVSFVFHGGSGSDINDIKEVRAF